MTIALTQAIAGLLGIGGSKAEDVNIRDDIHQIVKKIHSDRTARTALRASGEQQQGDFDKPFRPIEGVPGGPSGNNAQGTADQGDTGGGGGDQGGQGGQRTRTIFRPHARGLGAGSARVFQVQQAPTVTIARPKPGEVLGPDGRTTRSNLRLVQVSNATQKHELGKYNTQF